jgi:hypothetical protein
MNTIEAEICTHLQHEGLGSVYERVVLSRWFRDLARQQGYRSVMEYSCGITKGYDTITFIEQGLQAIVADPDAAAIEAGWKFKERPRFTTLEDAPPADLVWNFAQVQMNPALLDAMKPLARKHILIFVPNILNAGTPVHLTYHLLTRTACRHAERGSVRIRTRGGLLQLLADHGIEVITSGYIDAPLIPDIAFSIRELKQTLGRAQPAATNGQNGNGHSDQPPAAPGAVYQRVQWLGPFETNRLLSPFKPIVGHHIWALGRVAS